MSSHSSPKNRNYRIFWIFFKIFGFKIVLKLIARYYFALKSEPKINILA